MIEPSTWASTVPQVDVTYADRPSIPELVARHAAQTPDAPAIVCGDRITTYRQLQNEIDGLCARLLGVTAPPQRVAVLLDRSEAMIVALLAILKSGNSYIPLDPNYPEDRLAHVIADAAPAAIISKSHLLGALRIGGAAPIFIDRDHESLESGSTSILDLPRIDPDAVAYVIYTSGSTGVPKGVQIRHRSLMNLLFSMKDRPGLDARDVLLAVTTISFDIAALELFLPLVAGARIVLAREADVIDGASLKQLMRHHGVTVLQATPTTWQLLIAADWRDSKLKMLCGGEALSRHLAEQLLDRGGELWNMYGPTETTVWSSVLRVTSCAGPVLLGPPIANTYFRVLDEELRPVVHGEQGELFIGGEGVAVGYVNLPELTARKFVADPISNEPGARLYRTGDIVRERKKNAVDCLEFLGRSDHQVKIRGFRIELGEIESTLLRNPAVAQAVAVGVQRGPEPAIRAYIVLRSGATSLTDSLREELRDELKRMLPSYMHPSSIVALAELPRTPNGKIDRAALPEPSIAAPLRSVPSRLAPASEIERKLLTIWNDLLPQAPIDVNSDFFELGGSSLLAARLLHEIETRFDARLTLPALFGAPTIAAQARLLGELNTGDYDFRQVVRLHATGSSAPLLVIHNTGVYSYRLAQLLGIDQPLVALQLFDPSRKSLPTTIEDIAAEYIQLMRHTGIEPPYRLIGWCVGGVLAYEIARQLRARDHAVDFLAMIDSWAPGHLRRQSKLHAWLRDRSFRLQLILTDWRKTRVGQQSILDFLGNRVMLKKLLRVAGDVHSQPLGKMFADRHRSGEHYDRWLARYLEEVAERYEPKPYDGKVRLLRSSREPRGWLLDPLMGWENFAIGGIETEILDGDHFTVFRGVGLQQLANYLSLALAPER